MIIFGHSVLLFFVAGVLGGYAGYLQGPPSPDVLTSEKRKFLRFRSIVFRNRWFIPCPCVLDDCPRNEWQW